jgi:hypothetical protein
MVHTEAIQLLRGCFPRLPRQLNQCRLVPQGLRAHGDIAEATKDPHQPSIGDAFRAVFITAQNTADGIISAISPLPRYDTLEGSHHHPEDPRSVRPWGRKPDGIGPLRVRGHETKWITGFAVEMPDDPWRYHKVTLPAAGPVSSCRWLDPSEDAAVGLPFDP